MGARARFLCGGDRQHSYRAFQIYTTPNGQRQRPNYANQERPYNPHKDDIGIRYRIYLIVYIDRAIIF